MLKLFYLYLNVPKQPTVLMVESSFIGESLLFYHIIQATEQIIKCLFPHMKEIKNFFGSLINLRSNMHNHTFSIFDEPTTLFQRTCTVFFALGKINTISTTVD